MPATDPLATLATRRLTLRAISERDTPDLLALYGDPDVSRYRAHDTLRDLDDARRYFDEVANGSRSGRLLEWAITQRAEDRLIGTCTLSSVDAHNRRAELGYGLLREWWGQGFASEAAAAVIAFAFDTLGLERVYADSDPRNTASSHVLERLGFRREGLLRRHYFKDGVAQDAEVWGLLNDDRGLGGTSPG